MMRLKDNCDIVAFLDAAQNCASDVFLVTKEGDRLNLKSTLSRYVFAVIAENNELMAQSEVECTAEDRRILAGYIVKN